MKLSTRHAHKLLATAFFLAISAHVRAQSPIWSDVIGSDLKRWAQSAGAIPANSRLIIFSPFRPIDPNLTSGELEKKYNATSALVDVVPLPYAVYSDSGVRVYTIYRSILDNRAPETFILTKEEHHKLRQSEEVLLKHRCWIVRIFFGDIEERIPSKKLEVYQKYATKRAKIATRLLKNADSESQKKLQKELSVIDENWKLVGYKDEVERAIEQFESIQKQNPEREWFDLEKKIQLNSKVINGERFPITTLDPDAANWESSANWKSVSGARFTAEFLIVKILRPWFSLDTIESSAWQWNDGVYKQESVLISDGLGFDTPMAGKELMPLVPTDVIVVRNVKVDGVLQTANMFMVGLISQVIVRLPVR